MLRLSTHVHPAPARIAAETVPAITPKFNALEPSVHDDRAAMIAYQNPSAWEEPAFVLILAAETPHR
jgi:hypothetical protein